MRGRRSPSRTSRWTARGRCTRRGCASSTATSTPRSSFGSGKSSPGVPARDLPAPDGPVHAHAARRRPGVARRAPGARACSTPGMITEREMAEIVARSRQDGDRQPVRAGDAATSTSTRCSKEPYVTAPLRQHDLPPISDGACRGASSRAATRRKAAERAPGVDPRHRPPHRDPPARDARPHRRRRRRARGRGGRRRRRAGRRRRAVGDVHATRRRSCARRSASATTSRSTRRAARSRRTR